MLAFLDYPRSCIVQAIKHNMEFLLPSGNTVAIVDAFLHNQSFWNAKSKIPSVGGIDQGIRKSAGIRIVGIAGCR